MLSRKNNVKLDERALASEQRSQNPKYFQIETRDHSLSIVIANKVDLLKFYCDNQNKQTAKWSRSVKGGHCHQGW